MKQQTLNYYLSVLLFQAPPHSVIPESFTLPPGGAGVWGVGGYIRTWFLSVAPSHFSSALALSLQGLQFFRSIYFTTEHLLLHLGSWCSHCCVSLSSTLLHCLCFLPSKNIFCRNATSLSCGLSCVLWWVYWTLFSSQWAIFHKFLSMPENYFEK